MKKKREVMSLCCNAKLTKGMKCRECKKLVPGVQIREQMTWKEFEKRYGFPADAVTKLKDDSITNQK